VQADERSRQQVPRPGLAGLHSCLQQAGALTVHAARPASHQTQYRELEKRQCAVTGGDKALRRTRYPSKHASNFGARTAGRSARGTNGSADCSCRFPSQPYARRGAIQLQHVEELQQALDSTSVERDDIGYART